MSSNWRWSRQSASTRRLRPGLEFEKYMVVVCSLALMVVLVVGATGYASIRGLLSADTTAANAARSDARKDTSNHEADRDNVATPAAIALALIAVLLAVAATPSRIKTAGALPGCDERRRASSLFARKLFGATEALPPVYCARFEPRPPMRHAMKQSARAASRRRYPIDTA